MKSILFKNGTNANSKVVSSFMLMACNTVTNMLSIRLQINIIEYTLFSIKSILFFAKYIINNNAEKNIEQPGKRIPDISSPYYYFII